MVASKLLNKLNDGSRKVWRKEYSGSNSSRWAQTSGSTFFMPTTFSSNATLGWDNLEQTAFMLDGAGRLMNMQPKG